MAAALAAFERTLIALDSPYDRFRAGDGAALSDDARQGASLFVSHGCAACHAGRDLTDERYHQLGPAEARDPGLSEKTGNAKDAGRFRTPPLRNVAVTGPWWHDGSARTLEEAVRRHRLALPEMAMPSLLAFLDSLTDRAFLTDPRFAMPDRACGKRL
ncbi:cytochrome-c peroxidase [Sphingobium sp. EM0848]|uniref:cytochrome-c peroxidase n=1 Tax=Sphingobium sp. EM0848 TaxID=2743473 RepID=UPI00159C8625|nr:hypothetical protein [Sphingobium sp. EM0848]